MGQLKIRFSEQIDTPDFRSPSPGAPTDTVSSKGGTCSSATLGWGDRASSGSSAGAEKIHLWPTWPSWIVDYLWSVGLRCFSVLWQLLQFVLQLLRSTSCSSATASWFHQVGTIHPLAQSCSKMICSSEKQKEPSKILTMLIRNYPPREKTPPGESSGPPVEEEVQVFK